MKMTKKVYSMLLIFCLLVTLMPLKVSASSTKLTFSTKTSGSGNAITVKNVKYDGAVNSNKLNINTSGTLYEFEVDFTTNVSWKNTAKISSVKDNKSNSYKAYLADIDNDECDIYISNLKEGRTYTIVINGIKVQGTSSYRKLTLTVKVPSQQTSAQGVQIKKVSVDDDGSDVEVDVEFTTKVAWKNGAKVTSIKDDKGNSYSGRLTDIDDDECEICIENATYGRTYTIKISGVKVKGASSYETITVTAKVPTVIY